MIADEMLARVADRRMDDAFQGRELVAIGKDDCGKTLAVKRAGPDAAGKDLADFLDQAAARRLKSPNDCVGVEHGHASGLEHLRDGGLAHADRPGERDLDHASNRPRSRKAPSKGISGIPSIVKLSPSITENNCTPRASSRNTPTV